MASASISATSGSGDMARRLRVETAPAHLALEARVDIDARLRSIEAYGALLAALHPFHRTLEDLIARCPGWERLEPPLDLRGRRKAQLLADDLRALGSAPAAGDPRAPRVRGLAGALGALYVAEGATLGGALIARRAAAELGLSPEHGLAFFTCYGDHRGERWKTFQRSLADFAGPASPAERDDVVRGATATFQALDTWLEECA